MRLRFPDNHRNRFLELTPDQLRAARACGCALAPATEDQVRRLSMQRRIFCIGGMPFVAARDGGFFETHGTLAALIEKHRPWATTERGAEADVTPAQEAAPTPAQVELDDTGTLAAALGAPTPAEPEVARAERNVRRRAAATPSKPRSPRASAAPASTDATSTVEAVAEPSEADTMLAAVEAAQGSGPKARVLGRRRAGQPPTPRWMTAGKERRGRLK